MHTDIRARFIDPQIVYRISDKQFFVERQKLALSAKICINLRHLRQKIQFK
jgi:hypothetical protein